MNSYYLDIGKRVIETGDIIEFCDLVQNYIESIQDKEYHFSQQLFKDLFIHACLKGKLDIMKELYRHYIGFSPFDKIGLSPTFSYCRYICKYKEIKDWLEKIEI